MTSVPAALSALVAIAEQALPGVLVGDGPWLQRPSDPDIVAIGLEDPDTARAVQFTEAFAGLDSTQESYDVMCLASSWTGDTDMAARRARTDEMLEILRAALRADPTMGGVVMRARLATLSLDQFQASNGCEVISLFTVHIDAYRLD